MGSTTYTSIKIYYYNETTEVWELVNYVRIGNTFEISLDHASLFAFIGVPPYVAPSGGDDDDDDDKKETAIPFGNYYLLFLALAIIGLVIYSYYRDKSFDPVEIPKKKLRAPIVGLSSKFLF